MNRKISNLALIKQAYFITAKSFKNNPILLIPFVIFAILEFLSLIFLYLIPRAPLNNLFGPPIRTFWGEQFLHYPANFLLLHKLTSLARMGLAIFAGSLLTGVAVVLVLKIYQEKRLTLRVSFTLALKKYLVLFLAVLLVTAFFYFLTKFIGIGVTKYFTAGHQKLLFIGPRWWLGPILPVMDFVLAWFIQAAFAYVIPLVIIDDDKLFPAILKSLVIFKKMLIPTLTLVLIPLIFYLPLIILKYKTAFLIANVFPEVVLWVAILGIIVNNFLVDPLVTISTTFLYLMHKETK